MLEEEGYARVKKVKEISFRTLIVYECKLVIATKTS